MIFLPFIFAELKAQPVTIKYTHSIELLGDKPFPEGIAINEKTGAIYVGNLVSKSIQVLKNEKAEYLISPESVITKNVIGLAIDEERNRLWVCTSDFEGMIQGAAPENPEVIVINIKDKKIEKSFTYQGGGFFNDIVIDNSGNAYITNSLTASVHKVDHELKELSTLFQKPEINVVPNGFNLNGIEITPNEKYLILSIPAGPGSKLIRFSLDNSSLETIQIEGSFSGGDGLLFLNEKEMIAVNQGLNIIEFSDDYLKAKSWLVSEFEENALDFPTTVAKYMNQLYVVNSQLDHWVPFFQPAREGIPPKAVFTISEFEFSKK